MGTRRWALGSRLTGILHRCLVNRQTCGEDVEYFIVRGPDAFKVALSGACRRGFPKVGLPAVF